MVEIVEFDGSDEEWNEVTGLDPNDDTKTVPFELDADVIAFYLVVAEDMNARNMITLLDLYLQTALSLNMVPTKITIRKTVADNINEMFMAWAEKHGVNLVEYFSD